MCHLWPNVDSEKNKKENGTPSYFNLRGSLFSSFFLRLAVWSQMAPRLLGGSFLNAPHANRVNFWQQISTPSNSWWDFELNKVNLTDSWTASLSIEFEITSITVSVSIFPMSNALGHIVGDTEIHDWRFSSNSISILPRKFELKVFKIIRLKKELS